jgi:hypothetical protein
MKVKATLTSSKTMLANAIKFHNKKHIASDQYFLVNFINKRFAFATDVSLATQITTCISKNKYLFCLENHQSNTKINKQSGGNAYKNSNKGVSRGSIHQERKHSGGREKTRLVKWLWEKREGLRKVKGGCVGLCEV